MITIRTGSYSKDDVNFLAGVLYDGLSKGCYAIEMKGKGAVCDECKNRIACNEAQSALHHLYSVYYQKLAESDSEK